MREIFGENLKRIRAEKAITQEQLSLIHIFSWRR